MVVIKMKILKTMSVKVNKANNNPNTLKVTLPQAVRIKLGLQNKDEVNFLFIESEGKIFCAFEKVQDIELDSIADSVNMKVDSKNNTDK